MRQNALPDFSEAQGRRLLIALSGGADSVALTEMLCRRRNALNLTLFAVHVNHQMRGQESLADETYCRALCRRLEIELRVVQVDVPRLARESGEGLETAARRLRYAAMETVRAELDADWIALAHHRDDQAETVLMHLLRGCGPEGMGGMARLSGRLYRPLLDVTHQALEEYLKALGVQWQTDGTNLIPDTPRNALRLHGFPVLEESYPGARAALARHAESARCENRLLDRMTEAFLESHLETGPYGRRLVRPEEADEAILRRAIRKIAGTSIAHDLICAAAALSVQTRGKLDLSGTLFVERTPAALYFLPKRPFLPEPARVVGSGMTSLQGIGTLRAAPCAPVPVRDAPLCQVLRADVLDGAVLRTRREGDRIRPLGCGDRLLSDVLTDRKIDRPLRDCIPLVAVGNRVLWAVGVCISEEAKLLPETRKALRLEFIPEV